MARYTEIPDSRHCRMTQISSRTKKFGPLGRCYFLDPSFSQASTSHPHNDTAKSTSTVTSILCQVALHYFRLTYQVSTFPVTPTFASEKDSPKVLLLNGHACKWCAFRCSSSGGLADRNQGQRPGAERH